MQGEILIQRSVTNLEFETGFLISGTECTYASLVQLNLSSGGISVSGHGLSVRLARSQFSAQKNDACGFSFLFFLLNK